jgi:YD repeat-containing protein
MKNSSRAIQDRETKKFTYFWTAISKPPYFTALALWPKYGSWDGGGLFKSNNSIFLNHEKEVAEPHPNHKPGPLEVILKDWDKPIFSERLERDGWALRQEWKGEPRATSPYDFRTVQPEIREKANGPQVIRLIRSSNVLDFSDEFAVVSGEDKIVASVERAGWVDWDQQGRLVFVRDGGIFSGRIEADGRLAEHQLADLNSSKPSPLEPPQWATRW